jgi:hypothetical protein
LAIVYEEVKGLVVYLARKESPIYGNSDARMVVAKGKYP